MDWASVEFVEEKRAPVSARNSTWPGYPLAAANDTRNLPGGLHEGAGASQDLLCRSLGRCRAGRPIDREFWARPGAHWLCGDNLFTYVCYHADLSDEALQAFGIRDPSDASASGCSTPSTRATASRHRTPRHR
jgi:hypothetical protein